MTGEPRTSALEDAVDLLTRLGNYGGADSIRRYLLGEGSANTVDPGELAIWRTIPR